MPQIELKVTHPTGLHARPASVFVQKANQFKCEIVVTYGARTVNAKSIIGILSLGADQGAVIQITAEGEDADDALLDIKTLVENNFSLG